MQGLAAKFKGKKKISTLARNTGRRSFSELIGPDGQLTCLQKSHGSEESFGTDSTFSQAEKVAEDMAKAGGADKQPTLRQQTRSSLKRPKPWASRGEEDDDILQGFDDPLKYHPAHAAGHDGTKASTAFRVYQQGGGAYDPATPPPPPRAPWTRQWWRPAAGAGTYGVNHGP